MPTVHRWNCYAVVLILAVSVNVSSPRSTAQSADCIAIVGDSVAEGSVVTVIPGSGFPVLMTRPFSDVLAQELTDAGYEDLQVLDATVGATSLVSQADKPTYFETEAYKRLLAAKCAVVVIFPWLNDLRLAKSLQGARFIEQFDRLIRDIARSNPQSDILILGYFQVDENRLAQQIYEISHFRSAIATLNQMLFEYCMTLDWRAWSVEVTCQNTQVVLGDVDYLLRSIDEQTFDTRGYTPTSTEAADWFRVFWDQNPGGTIMTDGAHLNHTGKRELAVYIRRYLATPSENPGVTETQQP